MFKFEGQANYENIFVKLVEKIFTLDFSLISKGLGIEVEGEALKIRFFNMDYRLDAAGVTDSHGKTPDITHRIVICYYVIHSGDGLMSSEWVGYRDFKDARFFTPTFRASAEEKIAAAFSGRKQELIARCEALGGEKTTSPVDADVCMKFFALPRIPILLNFFDADDDFPADARILFDKSAYKWIDMECLAVTGMILANLLIEEDAAE